MYKIYFCDTDFDSKLLTPYEISILNYRFWISMRKKRFIELTGASKPKFTMETQNLHDYSNCSYHSSVRESKVTSDWTGRSTCLFYFGKQRKKIFIQRENL